MGELRDFIDQSPLFDTHEHLFGFHHLDSLKDRILWKELLESYGSSAVVTAHGRIGGTRADSWFPREDSFMDVLSWIREPGDEDYVFSVWRHVATTGYGEAVELATKAATGLDFSRENTAAISAAYRAEIGRKGGAGVYRDWMDRARIVGILNHAYWSPLPDDWQRKGGDFPDYLRHTLYTDLSFPIRDRGPIGLYERQAGREFPTLKDWDEGMHAIWANAMATGRFGAVKVGCAYSRPLDFEVVDFGTAAPIYEALRRGEERKDAKLLGDYFFHKEMERADAFKLPVQIHTGLLAGNFTNVFQGDPAPLLPVFRRYRNVAFDLFHASWPHHGMAAAIAKSFPNVWLDLCWAWAIDPEGMERTLGEWLSALPSNKILGFGGDTSNPWNLYAYSLQARRGIANCLESKVARGVYSAATALQIAEDLLWRNGKELFGFGRDVAGIA